ncbi:MAG: Maf family protein [Candidatus Gracilibacteria bacterium]|nr:Maf family protein [Candidatus Gracilibacteria bacterium]
MEKRKIILASKSERRKNLLKQIGLTNFEIIESNYEEDMCLSCDYKELVKTLALNKGLDVAKNNDEAIVISGDTIVVFEGKFLGKPKNRQDAIDTLKSYSGKELIAVSGYAVIDTKTGVTISGYEECKIKFRNLKDEEIIDYVDTQEPMDKAGSFGIMHRGAVLIESVDGDFYSIVAFPVNKIYLALKELGVNILKY